MCDCIICIWYTSSCGTCILIVTNLNTYYYILLYVCVLCLRTTFLSPYFPIWKKISTNNFIQIKLKIKLLSVSEFNAELRTLRHEGQDAPWEPEWIMDGRCLPILWWIYIYTYFHIPTYIGIHEGKKSVYFK